MRERIAEMDRDIARLRGYGSDWSSWSSDFRPLATVRTRALGHASRSSFECGATADPLLEMNTRRFTNWNKSASSTPRVVAAPRDVDQLIAVVKDEDAYPSPLRVGGSFHSLNACFANTGTPGGPMGLAQVSSTVIGVKLVNAQDWERFLEIRQTEDPDGRFLNDYFRELM
ncbi:MAG: hypothetical protein ACT4PO_13525 [Actinomycetota bacterium]